MTTNTKFYLPPEIISCIIASVSSKSSLCNLALASAQLYSLTVPVLYEDVELYSRHRNFEKLQPLTILFLNRPTLAQYVRRFTVRDPYQTPDPPSHDNKTELPDISGVLGDASFANSHTPEEVQEWTWHVGRDYPDAILALLLPTMVRLEKLDIMLRSGYRYFDRMIRRAVAHEKPFDCQPLFPALTEFMHLPSWEPDVVGGFNTLSWNFEPICSNYTILFQSFPRIRSIFGFCVGNNDQYPKEKISKNCPASTGMSSLLTHLELKSSFVRHEDLCIMLKIPNALSTFIYEIVSADSYEPDYTSCPLDILYALSPHYNSLECLWLDCLGSDDLTLGSKHVYNNAPLLVKFKRLKSLRISAEILLCSLYPDDHGIPYRRNFSLVFPATLEILHIKYMSRLIFWDELRGFVLTGLKQVPRLQKIFVEFRNFREAPSDWKELQEHAKSQGVDSLSEAGVWTGL
jgi:hypothetical protein